MKDQNSFQMFSYIDAILNLLAKSVRVQIAMHSTLA